MSKFNKKFNLFNKKLKLLIFLITILLIVLFLPNNKLVFASGNNVNSDIGLSIENIIDSLDFSNLQTLVDDISYGDFGIVSIKDKITEIVKGNYANDYGSVFNLIFGNLLTNIQNLLPFIVLIISIGILSNVILNFTSNEIDISNIVSFVCMSLISVIIITKFKGIILLCGQTIQNISSQMELIFPILITLLSTVGSTATISIYNPLVSVLTTIVTFLFEKLLYPMFTIILILCLLGNLTETIKLNKLQDFLMSIFKWSIGTIFTLFTGFLGIQGISAGKFDSISIKTTKFAVKNYIPIIGSYISEGMDFVVLGSILVKNSVGLIGIFILFVSIISPIIQILLVKLSLQLISGILEMLNCNKISNYVFSCSKVLILPIVIILGISLMYIITIAIIMSTANII